MSWRITPQQPVPVDPIYGNVSLLLHGNGTNGSTVITDNSPSPKTVTSVGGAKINTTQNKFGGSSISFRIAGESAYLDIPTLSFAIDESFTLEAWLYKTARDSSGYSNIFSGGGGNQFGYDLTTATDIFMYIDAGFAVAGSGTAVTLNNWLHLAWTRDGSTCRAFVNGVQQGTGTRGNAFTISRIGSTSSGAQTINGYLDEVRITKGIARYTANFTPPAAPFPDA
jgi:hypothetical protein